MSTLSTMYWNVVLDADKNAIMIPLGYNSDILSSETLVLDPQLSEFQETLRKEEQRIQEIEEEWLRDTESSDDD